jgi:GNAT superfamily N-acetyltransferase
MKTMKAQSITVVNTRYEHIRPLAELQPIVFPTLHPSELLREDHFLNHLKLFPEGQFVALNHNCEPVGSTTTFRINFDFDFPHHSFIDIIDGGWLTNHDPDGEWLYGADMNVHPAYRGLGISKVLYQARTKLCERLNLRGQIAGGHLPGYVKYANRMNAQAYCMKVVRGQLTDPTLTPQLKAGYQFVGVIEDYYESEDPAHRPASLIVKPNPRYIDEKEYAGQDNF